MIVALMFLLAALYVLLGMYVIVPIALAIFAALVLLFHTLLVEIDGDALRLTYGIGIIRKRFDLTTLGDAYPVRNKWWYGLGIRLTPHGWLYNVSGLDAVEIVGARARSSASAPMSRRRWWPR